MAARSYLKGASLLGVGQGMIALCSFLRNVVIARLISVEDFGIAIIFAMATTLLEMSSNLSLDRILVQDDEGGSDAMLASSHVLQFLRGLFGGVILFLLAEPIARLFKIPDVAWAFRMLALLPVIRGLVHWDMVVHQRNMDFRATAIVDSLPPLVSLIAAWVAASLLGDYRAMLIAVLCQALTMTGLSHLVARRPYRWSLRLDLARKKFRYGWPLLINGFLLYCIFQGDRILVGTLFDLTTLGWYGAAFALVLTPGMRFARVCGTLLMPGLARARHEPDRFARQCALAVALCIGCAAFVAVFFAAAGESLLLLAFGDRYAGGVQVLVLLALGQSLRLLRVAPTMISNSQAVTTNAMYSNLARLVGVPLAAVLALQGYGIEWVAISAIIGELLATVVSFRLAPVPLHRARVLRSVAKMTSGFVLFALVAWVIGGLLPSPQSPGLRILLVAAGGIAGLAAAGAVAGLDAQVRGMAPPLWRRVKQRFRAA